MFWCCLHLSLTRLCVCFVHGLSVQRLCSCLWQATASINELRSAVDTLIVVANDKLLEITDSNIPLERAFSVADDILRQVKWCLSSLAVVSRALWWGVVRCGAVGWGVLRCVAVLCGVVWCGVVGCDVLWCRVVSCHGCGVVCCGVMCGALRRMLDADCYSISKAPF